MHLASVSASTFTPAQRAYMQHSCKEHVGGRHSCPRSTKGPLCCCQQLRRCRIRLHCAQALGLAAWLTAQDACKHRPASSFSNHALASAVRRPHAQPGIECQILGSCPRAPHNKQSQLTRWHAAGAQATTYAQRQGRPAGLPCGVGPATWCSGSPAGGVQLVSLLHCRHGQDLQFVWLLLLLLLLPPAAFKSPQGTAVE